MQSQLIFNLTKTKTGNAILDDFRRFLKVLIGEAKAELSGKHFKCQ